MWQKMVDSVSKSKSTNSISYYNSLQGIVASWNSVSSNCLQSLNQKEKITFQSIDEAHKDCLEVATFTKVHIYKSPLHASIYDKACNLFHEIQKYLPDTFEKYLPNTFEKYQVFKYSAIICAMSFQQLFAHHLEIILEGTKKTQGSVKNILMLISYGADGLETKVKSFADHEKQNRLNQLSKRREKNEHLKDQQSANNVFQGKIILSFLKDYCGKRPYYNIAINNCHTFTQQFMKDVWGIKI